MGLSPMKKGARPNSPVKDLVKQPTLQGINLMGGGELSSENQFWKEEISRQVKDINQEINTIKYEKLGDDAHNKTLSSITNPLAIENDVRSLKKRMRQFEIEYETINKHMSKLS